MEDENFMNNFVGVFPAVRMTKFIYYTAMINEKSVKYSFLIASTGESKNDGTYYWSILDVQSKKDFS